VPKENEMAAELKLLIRSIAGLSFVISNSRTTIIYPIQALLRKYQLQRYKHSARKPRSLVSRPYEEVLAEPHLQSLILTPAWYSTILSPTDCCTSLPHKKLKPTKKLAII
jgi:hypothetical protein